jgi:formylglycine-generating enzyme required for sulfatase activity
MAAEVKRLRGAADGGADEEQPLYVPSLDSVDPAAGQMTAQPAPQPEPSPLLPESVVRAGYAVGRQEKDLRGMHPAFKAAVVVLLAVITAVAAWFMTGDGIINIDQTDVVLTEPGMPDFAAGDGGRPDAAADIEADASVPDESAPGVSAVPEIAARPAQPEPVAVPADTAVEVTESPDAAVQQKIEFVGTQPLRLEQPPLPEALPAGEDALIPLKPAGPPPVGRSFRDALKGGGKGPAMIELDAASFQMGSSGNSLNFDEGPRHTVRLPAFSMSKREITFAEYDRFARATGRRLPYDEGWGRGKRPVINVTWEDAVAYTRWLSAKTGKKYRLPSEAEWEYAARAGSDYSYWWTDTEGGIHANCFNCGSQWDGTSTAPVASFEANRYGLFDMTGNVQEWVEDCYHNSYTGAPADGNAWLTPHCQQRVVRGGAYSSPLDSLRSAKRAQLSQDTRLDNLGFRVVRDE